MGLAVGKNESHYDSGYTLALREICYMFLPVTVPVVMVRTLTLMAITIVSIMFVIRGTTTVSSISETRVNPRMHVPQVD